jgi:hypothetical protein
VIDLDSRPELNLLIVRYRGQVTPEEAAHGVGEAESCLTNLPREFRVLADLSALTSMAVACAPSIERVMDLCQKHGVAEVIRIIPDPSRDIGMQIMSLFHYSSGVRIFTCASKEEAFNLLSNAGELDKDAVRAAIA